MKSFEDHADDLVFGEAKVPPTDVNTVEAQGQFNLIEMAVGGSYENIGGRSFWIDVPVAKEIARRVVNSLHPQVTQIRFVCTSLLNSLAKDGLIVDHSDEKELIKGLLSSTGVSSTAADQTERDAHWIQLAQVTALGIRRELAKGGEPRLSQSELTDIILDAIKVSHASPSLIQPEASEEETATLITAGIHEKYAGALLPKDITWHEWKGIESIILAAIRKAKAAPVGQVHEGQNPSSKDDWIDARC